MTMSAIEIERALMALDQRDRAAVIQRALHSLGEPGTEVSAQDAEVAWNEEAGRRLEDITAGRAMLHDPEESHARIRVTLRDRNQ